MARLDPELLELERGNARYCPAHHAGALPDVQKLVWEYMKRYYFDDFEPRLAKDWGFVE